MRGSSRKDPSRAKWPEHYAVSNMIRIRGENICEKENKEDSDLLRTSCPVNESLGKKTANNIMCPRRLTCLRSNAPCAVEYLQVESLKEGPPLDMENLSEHEQNKQLASLGQIGKPAEPDYE